MFEVLETAAAAWRTIMHVSEWTGLSIGALGAGVALVIYVPAARRFVIFGAYSVVLGWLCLIHGDRTGSADVHKQWDAAKKEAAAEQDLRDTRVAFDLKQAYAPQLAKLQAESRQRKEQADAYEKQILALLAKPPAAGKPAADRCELGAAARGVRPGKQAQ